MICWGVPRTLPSGPELSNTRLIILPRVRGRFCLERERDLEERILTFGTVTLRLSPIVDVAALHRAFGVRRRLHIPGVPLRFSAQPERLDLAAPLLGEPNALDIVSRALLKPGETQAFLSLRLFRWADLQLMHYTELAATVAAVWPYAAFLYLLLLRVRDRHRIS